MGYTLGMPSLKLSNTAGKGGKHCGNFKKVTDEALEERLGQDLDINHDKTLSNEYLTEIKTAAELQNISETWIKNYNDRIDKENIQIEEDIKKAVKEYNDTHEEKLTKVKALKAINDERRANKQEPLQTKRHIRDDAVVMCATIIKPSAEFMSTLSSDAQRQMLLDSYEKLKEIVGESNMKAAVIHNDELVPHLHTFWMPETEDGRLCAKEKHNLKFLGKLNKEMPAYLRSKGWDIDDCNAYDAEEEQRKKEEMGEEAYKKDKQEKRQNRGRSSSKFKYEEQKKVEELEKKETELEISISNKEKREAELVKSISEKKQKEENTNAELKEVENKLYDKKDEFEKQVLAFNLGESYPKEIEPPSFPRPDQNKNNWISQRLVPDLNIFEKMKEQKLLGEIWEKQINEYKDYDAKVAERESKVKEWIKDYSSLSEIQDLYKKHTDLYELEKSLSEEYRRERNTEMERIHKYEVDSKAKLDKRESEVKAKEERVDKRITEIENERNKAVRRYNEDVKILKQFKAKMELEIQKKVSLLLQPKKHFEENLGFADRIRKMFNHKKIEREREAKERIIEIEDYVRSR